MKSLLQKLSGKSEPLKTPSNGLSEEQMNQITEAVIDALQSRLLTQQAHFVEEVTESIHKRLHQWTTITTSDLNGFRRCLTDTIDQMKLEIHQITKMVEEMTTGKGEPNKDLLALAARIQDLESLCQSHAQKISALQLQRSGQSSKR